MADINLNLKLNANSERIFDVLTGHTPASINATLSQTSITNIAGALTNVSFLIHAGISPASITTIANTFANTTFFAHIAASPQSASSLAASITAVTTNAPIPVHLVANQASINSLRSSVRGAFLAAPVDISVVASSASMRVIQGQFNSRTFRLNLTIGNLAALNAQIRDVFHNMGINVNAIPTPPRTRTGANALVKENAEYIARGNVTPVNQGFVGQNALADAAATVLQNMPGATPYSIAARKANQTAEEAEARHVVAQATYARRSATRGTIPNNFMGILTDLSQMHQAFPAGSEMHMKIGESHQSLVDALRNIGYKEEQRIAHQIKAEDIIERRGNAAEQDAIRQRKYQKEFDSKRRLDMAIHGVAGAANEFEEEKGLLPGTIRTRGLPRYSYDLNRAVGTRAARNELGFATLFGGPVGAVGGLVGGGLFGEGGIFIGSAIAQKVTGDVVGIFMTVANVLHKAAEKGIEFHNSILSIAAAFSTSTRITSHGKEVSTAESVKEQNRLARQLVKAAQPEMAKLGLGSEQQSAILRGVVSGFSEAGMSFTQGQVLRSAKVFGGVASAIDPAILQNMPRLVQDISEILAAAPTAQRTQLGIPLRKLMGEMKHYTYTGDTEGVVKTLEKMSGVLAILTGTSDNAGTSMRKLHASMETASIRFSDVFVSHLIKPMERLAEALSNPNTLAFLEKLGDLVGKMAEAGVNAATATAQAAGSWEEGSTPISKRMFDPESWSKGLQTAGAGFMGPMGPGRFIPKDIKIPSPTDFLVDRTILSPGRDLAGVAGTIASATLRNPELTDLLIEHAILSPSKDLADRAGIIANIAVGGILKGPSGAMATTAMGFKSMIAQVPKPPEPTPPGPPEGNSLVQSPHIERGTAASSFARQMKMYKDEEKMSEGYLIKMADIMQKVATFEIGSKVGLAQYDRLKVNTAFQVDTGALSLQKTFSEYLTLIRNLTPDYSLMRRIPGVTEKPKGPDMPPPGSMDIDYAGAPNGHMIGLYNKYHYDYPTKTFPMKGDFEKIESPAPEKLINFTNALMEPVPALRELKLATEEAKASLKDLANDRELERLQGLDKLETLAGKIKEAGGVVPPAFVQGFNSFEDKGLSGKTRKAKEYELEFKQLASKLETPRFEAGTEHQRTATEMSIRGQQEKENTFGITSKIQMLQKTKEMYDFLDKLPKESLNGIKFPVDGKELTPDQLKDNLANRLKENFKEPGVSGVTDWRKLIEKMGKGEDPMDALNTSLKNLIKSIDEGVAAAKEVSGAFSR